MISTPGLAGLNGAATRERGANPVPHRIEQLERNIAGMRMAAATDTDWEQLHIRSREIFKRLDRKSTASAQVAAALRMRADMHRAKDLPGLRALRFATAGLIVNWLGGVATHEKAELLAQLFSADQSRGTPGLADLEAELDRARACVWLTTQVDPEVGATGTGSVQAF